MRKMVIAVLLLAIGLTGCNSRASEPSTGESPVQTDMTVSDATVTLDRESLADQVDSYVQTGGMADGQSVDPGLSEDQGQDDGQAADDLLPDDGSDAPGETQAADTISFEVRDDTVYATTNVVVRNQPSATAEPVMNLLQGESAHRVGYSAEWTKIERNGYYYYVATRYLSESVQ